MDATQTRKCRTTVTVMDPITGLARRLSLGEPDGDAASGYGPGEEVGTGYWWVACWVGRKHVILETYSQWEDSRTHGCVGTRYRLAAAEDLEQIGEVFGEPVARAAARTLHVSMEDVDGEVAS